MNPSPAKPDRCVLVFVRAPQPGRVKTRLEPALARARVADLYRAFVTDVMATLDVAGYPVRICYCPEDQGQMVRSWLGPHRAYQPQDGPDLGQRMARALTEAFASGHDQALVVGSDLPDLPVEIIHQAFSRLLSTDAVIGPATDGGYYLIGFRADGFDPAVFARVAWGSRRALEETTRRMDSLSIACHQLPQWPDVDEPADLVNLAHRLRRCPGAAPKTAAFLASVPGFDEIVVKPK